MRTRKPFGILSGLALLATATLSSTVALADSVLTVQSRNVHYTQADLTDPTAAGALYRRIERAARLVCGAPAEHEIDRYQEFRRCYDKAVDSAVANVNATALTAIHRSKTQRTAAG